VSISAAFPVLSAMPEVMPVSWSVSPTATLHPFTHLLAHFIEALSLFARKNAANFISGGTHQFLSLSLMTVVHPFEFRSGLVENLPQLLLLLSRKLELLGEPAMHPVRHCLLVIWSALSAEVFTHFSHLASVWKAVACEGRTKSAADRSREKECDRASINFYFWAHSISTS